MNHTVVVGTHGSPAANLAVRRAATIAATMDYQLVIVSAYRPVSQSRLTEELRQAPYEIHWKIKDGDVERLIEDAACLARDRGVDSIRTSAQQASPARAILDAADRWDAHRIVLGQGGVKTSSVIKRVCRRARCQVTVVGGHLVETVAYRPSGIARVQA